MGVIQNNVQWEHCNNCGQMVPLHSLQYLRGSPRAWQNNIDLCFRCATSQSPITLRWLKEAIWFAMGQHNAHQTGRVILKRTQGKPSAWASVEEFRILGEQS